MPASNIATLALAFGALTMACSKVPVPASVALFQHRPSVAKARPSHSLPKSTMRQTSRLVYLSNERSTPHPAGRSRARRFIARRKATSA